MKVPTILRNGKAWSGLVVVSLTLVLLVNLFSLIGQAEAQTEKHVGNKKSLVVSCEFTVFTFDAVKLGLGDSKTVECVAAPTEECTRSPDICLKTSPTHPDLADARVFWCNHDNTFAKVDYETMKFGDDWSVTCG